MIDDFSNQNVGEYLDALASAAPAPGGGSAVAVAGALAAALAQMVCRLSIGRSETADADEALQHALDSAEQIRSRLQQLSVEDAAAYSAYVAATGLPKATAAEKAARRAAMQAALKVAADVPLDVASTCLNLVERLEPIARLGNKHVLSDVEVALFLAEAAARGALANVRVNARLMRNGEMARDYLDRADGAEVETRTAAAAILDAVCTRAGVA